jgi:hypothetical protein
MYIPKGKIDPQFYYTEGGEWYYSTTRTPYKGYYHLDLYGRGWTGKEHTNESIELVKPPRPKTPSSTNINSVSSNYYTSIIQKTGINQSINSVLPENNSEPPSLVDYSQTYYTRYILEYKLSSQPFYIEVNKDTYYGLINSNQNTYFNGVEVLWKISGPLYDQKENGVLVQGGVIDSNKRSITKSEQTMPGIQNYLVDLTLYYKP